MFVCRHAIFEHWSPDLSTSGLTNPRWIRAKCDTVELCNSLGWVEWCKNPVQVQLCRQCGTSGCASGGYIHLSTLNEFVLWTAPQTNGGLGVDQISPATVIGKLGAVAFQLDVWSQFRGQANVIPDARRIPPATGAAIRDAWIVGPNRPRGDKRFRDWLHRRAIAADSLEIAEALAWVEYWLEWCDSKASEATAGSIASAEDCGALIETLYFEGPGTHDWPALAQVGGRIVPALSPTHVFLPSW